MLLGTPRMLTGTPLMLLDTPFMLLDRWIDVEMSCPAQAPHNKYIVGPRLSQHYGNYTPAHRRSIAAQPAWVHRIFGLGRHLISEFL